MFNTRQMQRLLLSTAVVGLFGCDAPQYNDVFTPEGDIERVVVRSDSGDIELVSGTHVRVERTIQARDGALDMSQTIHEDPGGLRTLFLDARCAAVLTCSVDQKIIIPDGVGVDIVLDNGDVWATGIHQLSVQLNRGAVDADIRGPLKVQVGDGSVQADLPLNTAATIAVGQGDIDLNIPPGPWKLMAQALALNIGDGIQDVDASDGQLELIAPAGAVHLRTAAALADSAAE
ncbi:MAG: hypothetical protein AAFV53_27510 [Myxococcota bacterium]